MSARLMPILIAGLCLSALNACGSKQAPAEAAEEAKPSTPAAATPPATTALPEAVAAAEAFVLETAVRRSDTFEALQKQYGDANIVKGELPGAEGETSQGWIIFPDDPEKKLMIYTDADNTHPDTLLVNEANSKWHLSNAIKLSTDSKTLEALNQKPFDFFGFNWDYGGVVTEWNGGALSKPTATGVNIRISLCPPEHPKLPDNYLMGDGTFSSSNPLAQAFPPVVCELGVYFPGNEKQ